jgi:hypothetical protein
LHTPTNKFHNPLVISQPTDELSDGNILRLSSTT